MKKILFFTVAFFVNATSFSQILDPVKWSYASKRISDTEAVVLIKATMDKGWHIYSQTVPKDGPQPTSFSFEPCTNVQPKPFSPVFGNTMLQAGVFVNCVILAIYFQPFNPFIHFDPQHRHGSN